MKPTAVVNGVAVYSDKSMTSIINDRIEFSDGSWCNVRTGEVSNRGPGFINIGKPGGEAAAEYGGEKITFGPKKFIAHTLTVQNLDADVEVVSGDEREMSVTVSGPKGAVDKILAAERGGSLTVEGPPKSVPGGNVVISGGGVYIGGVNGARIVTGNSIVIGGKSSSEVKISVSVPKGSRIRISGVSGAVNIGDVEGPFTAVVRGSGKMSVGHVHDADIIVQGSGAVDVDRVEGKLGIVTQGSGDVRIRGGRVSVLTASTMGSGDIAFDGQAENANLSVMGSGDITVQEVKNPPMKNILGSGDIRIRTKR